MIAEQIFPASVLDDDEALYGKGAQPDQGGFTILGSGEVALILDVPGLMKQVVTGEEPVGDRGGLAGFESVDAIKYIAAYARCYLATSVNDQY